MVFVLYLIVAGGATQVRRCRYVGMFLNTRLLAGPLAGAGAGFLGWFTQRPAPSQCRLLSIPRSILTIYTTTYTISQVEANDGSGS